MERKAKIFKQEKGPSISAMLKNKAFSKARARENRNDMMGAIFNPDDQESASDEE